MMDPDSLTGRLAVVTAVGALDIDEAVAACAASSDGERKVRTVG
jgi:hypothetical protein